MHSQLPAFFLFFSLFFIIFSFSYFFFELEDNCFAILCWPLPSINVNQPQVCTCPLPCEPPSTSPYPSHTSRLSQEYWVELPVSHSTFPPPICFIYDNVYVSMLFSQLDPPCPSPRVSTSLFSMSMSPFSIL